MSTANAAKTAKAGNAGKADKADAVVAAASSPAQLIDARIRELSDWRGEVLAQVRQLIRQAVPDVIEEWKWRGVPVWSHGGILCTGETYKSAVKLPFAKGAALEDPAGLFTASLDGNPRRAIDIHEGDAINDKALIALIRAAAALNAAGAKPARKVTKKATQKPADKPSR